mgnify:CR=1 FL=1
MSIGDLVKIRPGIEDEDIPMDRTGIVIKIYPDDIHTVQLSNGKKLQFSLCWLLLINEAIKKVTPIQV